MSRCADVTQNRLIVDAHHHVGDLSDSLSYDGRDAGPEPSVEDDAARRIAGLDAIGVAWAVIQPSHGYLRTDGIAATIRVNDRMAQLQALAPDRFRAVGTDRASPRRARRRGGRPRARVGAPRTGVASPVPGLLHRQPVDVADVAANGRAAPRADGAHQRRVESRGELATPTVGARLPRAHVHRDGRAVDLRARSARTDDRRHHTQHRVGPRRTRVVRVRWTNGSSATARPPSVSAAEAPTALAARSPRRRCWLRSKVPASPTTTRRTSSAPTSPACSERPRRSSRRWAAR